MNYQKQEESKYKHILFQNKDDKDILLLGVNKDISNEEATLLLNSPMINYPFEFWNTYFKLNVENRNFINNVLNKYEKKENNPQKFNSYYWDVLTDFLFTRYGVTLYDIACELEGNISHGQKKNRKLIYDRLDKLRKIKGIPRIETLSTIREICAYYMITDDVIKNGKGIIYSLAPKEYSEEFAKQVNNKYRIKAIREIWERDKSKELKDIILELTGLEENQLMATEIQIASRKEKVKKETLENLEIVMQELIRKQ